MGTVVNPVHRSLHVFTDASENGFGAVVYIRMSNGDDVDVNFAIAKTRVAPIKFMTIPRLELLGAVVGVRLATSICKELKLPLSEITYWTDSTTALQWLYSKKYRFQTFVANRVSEILENSSWRQWRHVPGRLNPADECSRGMSATSLSSQHRWFTGPPFLREPENQWPKNITITEVDKEGGEIAHNFVGSNQVLSEDQLFLSEFLQKYSSLNRAVIPSVCTDLYFFCDSVNKLSFTYQPATLVTLTSKSRTF